MDLGTTCPAGISETTESNEFSIDIFYKLYTKENNIMMTPVASIFVGNNKMFSSQLSFNVQGDLGWTKAITGSSSFSLPYLNVEETVKNVSKGKIYHSRFVFKTNPKTMGYYSFTYQTSNLKKSLFCAVKITKVGKNMPCYRQPEGIETSSIDVKNVKKSKLGCYYELGVNSIVKRSSHR